ncbi:efflux RND transporter periplasmic adaptor subunit [Patescibacteria group bacterium]|nr:efflux RND transporter periplasmic adaptor subunit [Patescibacteria group bacterium]
MKAKKGIIFVVVLIAAVGVFIAKQTVLKSSSTVQYTTAPVTQGPIVSTVTASGNVATTGRLPVSTEASGQVKAILVKDGDTVTAGQTLMTLSLDQTGQQRANQAWSSYLSAKNSLASAQTNAYSLRSTMFSKWKTYNDLATSSFYQNADGTPNADNRTLPAFIEAYDDWMAAEAAYQNQQNVIAQTQASVNNAWAAYQLVSPTVVAPMSGTVADVTFTTGMIISNAQSASSTTISSQQLMSIVTTANPVVTVDVAEIDVNSVKQGQQTTITADALTGKTFAATVVGVDRAGIVSSGVTNYPTTIQLDAPMNELLPNMSVTANIIVATKDNALLVPSTAVQSQGTESVVRVLVNGQEQTVPVTTGLSSDTETEITSGLTEGQEVVTGTAAGSSASTSFGSSGGFRFGGGGGAVLRPGGFGGR